MPVVISRKGADFFAGLLLVAVAAYAMSQLSRALKGPLIFDDSYMFYRYAMNIRHGLGMSWNMDGVPTYGETAPLWGFFVLLLSYLPMDAPHVLELGSWVCGVGAVLAMAWAVARNAESGLMKSTWRVLPMVAVPLVVAPIYMANALTGMETMLAVMLAAVFLGFAISWQNGTMQPQWVGLVGVTLFLTRPETAPAVLLVPLMFVLLGRGTKRGFFIFASVFVSGVLLDLLVCKLYFGTPLPLSFYMKSGHAYEGYHTAWHPLSNALVMIANCGLFLALISIGARKSEWRLVTSLLLPVLITFVYLCSVTQIMGWKSRYYVPYFAFFVVPALLIVDRRIEARENGSAGPWFGVGATILGCAALGAVAVVLLVRIPRIRGLIEAGDRHLERRLYVYDPVEVGISAAKPLPKKLWYDNIHEVGDVLFGPLPSGTTIAASEVGYLGYANLHGNVIDVEGLNDNQIALQGFSPDALLKRAPDIIWMPHPDYTYQRGVLLTNPALLKQYDLYAGVADYGLALRKDSAVRPQIDRQMALLWRDFYPGYNMQDYKVTSTSWTGRKYKPTEEQDRQEKRNRSNIVSQD